MPYLAITCTAVGPVPTPSRRSNQQFLSSRPSPLSNDNSNRGQHLYTQALQLARQQDHQAARSAFEECCRETPDNTKAWVSWAQFEKRVKKSMVGHGDKFHTCREVLQRGLFLNRNSAALIQAWGLMELQKGNILAAVLLLERSVQFDPKNSPVLKWRAVQLAQQTVLSRRKKISDMASKAGSQLFL